MGKSHSTWCSNSAQSSTYYHGSMRVRPGRFQRTPPDAIFQLPVWRNNASKLHGLSLWENHIRPGTRIPRKVQLWFNSAVDGGHIYTSQLTRLLWDQFSLIPSLLFTTRRIVSVGGSSSHSERDFPLWSHDGRKVGLTPPLPGPKSRMWKEEGWSCGWHTMTVKLKSIEFGNAW